MRVKPALGREAPEGFLTPFSGRTAVNPEGTLARHEICSTLVLDF